MLESFVIPIRQLINEKAKTLSNNHHRYASEDYLNFHKNYFEFEEISITGSDFSDSTLTNDRDQYSNAIIYSSYELPNYTEITKGGVIVFGKKKVANLTKELEDFKNKTLDDKLIAINKDISEMKTNIKDLHKIYDRLLWFIIASIAVPIFIRVFFP